MKRPWTLLHKRTLLALLAVLAPLVLTVHATAKEAYGTYTPGEGPLAFKARIDFPAGVDRHVLNGAVAWVDPIDSEDLHTWVRRTAQVHYTKEESDGSLKEVHKDVSIWVFVYAIPGPCDVLFNEDPPGEGE